MSDEQTERLIKALESIACALDTPLSKPKHWKEEMGVIGGELRDLSDWEIPPMLPHTNLNIPVLEVKERGSHL